MINNVKINIQVNNKRYKSEIEPRLLLVDYLRYQLKLTSEYTLPGGKIILGVLLALSRKIVTL